jgi:hypothetical protein
LVHWWLCINPAIYCRRFRNERWRVKNADENHVVAFRFFSSLVRQPCVLDHSLETEEYLPLAKPYFPSMNARELVDHIRSGPVELVLDKPLPRFRRRTRSNPCDFNEFLDALQSSETIYTAACSSHRQLGISEDEWVLLFKTLGRIRYMQTLTLWCAVGSRDFHILSFPGSRRSATQRSFALHAYSCSTR